MVVFRKEAGRSNLLSPAFYLIGDIYQPSDSDVLSYTAAP